MVMQMGSSKGETNNKQFHRIKSNWIESKLSANRIESFSSLPNRPALKKTSNKCLQLLQSSTDKTRP